MGIATTGRSVRKKREKKEISERSCHGHGCCNDRDERENEREIGE